MQKVSVGMLECRGCVGETETKEMHTGNGESRKTERLGARERCGDAGSAKKQAQESAKATRKARGRRDQRLETQSRLEVERDELLQAIKTTIGSHRREQRTCQKLHQATRDHPKGGRRRRKRRT